jgi:hypothetical protein
MFWVGKRRWYFLFFFGDLDAPFFFGDEAGYSFVAFAGIEICEDKEDSCVCGVCLG